LLVCGAGLALLGATLIWLLAGRHPLPGSRISQPEASAPAWWENPPPLTAEEMSSARYLSSVTWQLPRAHWMDCWNVGGQQYGVFSVRYQAAFAGYAFAALGMRTPACPVIAAAGLRDAIDHLLERRAWAYVSRYWKNKPWFPDPVANENIMYSGHLLQLVALYEALTGDDCYRTKGFDFVWDEKTRFHYTTLTLAEAVVRQMRRNACGGVACEPGLVFFPCNNHPQVGLLILENLGLGHWRAERQKWEHWALNSYAAPFGHGAFRLAYYLPARAIIPASHPGLDGWSLLWYQPWAGESATAERIWRETARRMDWSILSGKMAETAPLEGDPSCCRELAIPLPAAVSFLYPAAVACGDAARAAQLYDWMSQNFLTNAAGATFLNCPAEYRIGCTANFAIGQLLRHGSNLRHLVQRPLPRAYFDGPLVTELIPSDTRVSQAYRREGKLIVEIDSPGPVQLRLANVPAVRAVAGMPAKAGWRFEGGLLKLPGQGSRHLTIETGQ
jgi:hypothetical protein